MYRKEPLAEDSIGVNSREEFFMFALPVMDVF